METDEETDEGKTEDAGGGEMDDHESGGKEQEEPHECIVTKKSAVHLHLVSHPVLACRRTRVSLYLVVPAMSISS